MASFSLRGVGRALESDNLGETLLGVGSGALSGFAAGGPLGAVAGAALGFGTAAQAQQVRSDQERTQKRAQSAAKRDAQARRNELIQQQFQRRKSGQNPFATQTSPGQQNASSKGTVLTAGSNQPTSILGGNQ